MIVMGSLKAGEAKTAWGPGLAWVSGIFQAVGIRSAA